jgi:formyl-CoA transferase
MDRLGGGWAALRECKSDLVYCDISGFGKDGPMRDLPAYDQIIQGVSGVMRITGNSEAAPYRVGYPICDTIGGMTAAFAISALSDTFEAADGPPRECVADITGFLS